ncbi:MAG TPA: hypothetical protein VG097_06840 [Gemmata sp.]|nr:hypothetical protein [Gemmata sp.]
MAAVTFDTLKFANTLKAAKLPPDQAEAVATALSEAFQVNFRDIATKDDVRALEVSIKADLKAHEVSIKADLKALELLTKADIQLATSEVKALGIQVNHLKWVLGVGISTTLVMVGIILRLLLVRGV